MNQVSRRFVARKLFFPNQRVLFVRLLSTEQIGPKPTQDELRTSMKKESDRVTKIGVGGNIALVVIKGVAGVFGNSVAMVADAVHSLSDLLTDMITFASVRFAHRPSDATRPYGFGKFESIGTLSISTVLLFTGGGIGYHALEKINELIHHIVAPVPTYLALGGAVVSIAVKEWLYHITMKVGKKYDSKIMIAHAWHHRTDSVSSLVALVGVAGTMLNVPVVDPLAGVVVAGMIIKVGVEMGFESLKDLTDVSVDNLVLESISKIVQKDDGVKGFHQLRGRRMGPYMYIDVHIEVSPKTSVSCAHQVAERVRCNVLDAHPAVSEVMVHVDVEEDSKLEAIRNADEQRSLLMRSEKEIQKDVEAILNEPEWRKYILGLTHFTPHYLKRRLTVQLEVAMDKNLTIADAQTVATRLGRELTKRIKDIDWADIHVELNPYDIAQIPLKKNNEEGQRQ